MCHIAGTNGVFVGAPMLADASRFGEDQIIREHNEKNGQLLHVGTARELYFLIAVEEADHVRFQQYHPDSSQGEIPLSWAEVRVEEYDAQQHEFEALEKKLKAAESLNFTHELICLLRSRLEAACRVREKKS